MEALAHPQEALDGAHKLLSLFCLRRVKREVEVSLPPLIETRVECPLSSLQTFWYRRLLLREYQTLLKKVEAEEGGGDAPAAVSQEGAQEAGAWKKLQVSPPTPIIPGCDHSVRSLPTLSQRAKGASLMSRDFLLSL